MAYDPGLLELLRQDLAEAPGLVEKRMFGGVCMMLNGHMLCGVHRDGGMFRVGKQHYGAALALNGVKPLGFTGRPMTGMVDVGHDAFADDGIRGQLMDFARNFVESLPPKG